MRSIRWLGPSLGRSIPSPLRVWWRQQRWWLHSAAVGTQLLDRHGDLHRGGADHGKQPDQHRRSGDLVQREPVPSGGPEHEHKQKIVSGTPTAVTASGRYGESQCAAAYGSIVTQRL